MEQPNPKVENQFRVIIKFLFSFSLLFVLLFLLLPLLLQFFTYTIDKSYMFLLCNGILVFIAMNSGLINASSSPRTTTHQTIEEEVAVYNYNTRSSVHLEFNASEIAAPLADENFMEIIESSPLADENFMEIIESSPLAEEEKSLEIVEQEKLILDTHEDEDEGNEIMIIDEDEHGAEELNKKCEEFIRKMKATISCQPRAYYYCDNQKAMGAVN